MKYFLNLKPRSGIVYMAFKEVNRECRTTTYRSHGLYLLKLILTPKNGQKMDKNTQIHYFIIKGKIWVLILSSPLGALCPSLLVI